MMDFQKLILLVTGGKAMGFIIGICFLAIIAFVSTVEMGPDNIIEKEADALISKELGTTVNIDGIVDEAVEIFKVVEAPKTAAKN